MAPRRCRPSAEAHELVHWQIKPLEEQHILAAMSEQDNEEDLAPHGEDGERVAVEADPDVENEGDDETDEFERPETGVSQRPHTAKSVIFRKIVSSYFLCNSNLKF